VCAVLLCATAFQLEHARLWADTRLGNFAGKQCEWSDVKLVIFTHGAILSFVLDWIPPEAKGAAFSLADLRTWIYVAKFRSIKVGWRKMIDLFFSALLLKIRSPIFALL
jgi:hypothetical protein